MSWRDLLAKPELVVLPWTGGRELRFAGRTAQVHGPLPTEHGWHGFEIAGGRKASYLGPTDAPEDWFEGRRSVVGYLVGDRLIPDDAVFTVDATRIPEITRIVYLVENVGRFARVRAVEVDARLIFVSEEMPIGPEGDVVVAWEDRKTSIGDIPGVPPALDLAFRWESWRRDHAEQARRLLEQERTAREAERAARKQRDEAEKLMGTAEGRRFVAVHDFAAAARAALTVGGAEFLDWRQLGDEAVVRYRCAGRRLECVVDRVTLRVIDAGVCLVDHETGERGDDRFTLESLPSVIREADAEGALVVFRHLD